MKLVSLKVEKMHGYLDLDIPFEHNLVFLIGANGSGKTSALRLISAMTNGDISELMQIKFKIAELKILDNQNHPATILYEKNENTINVTYHDEKGAVNSLFTIPTMKIPNLSIQEFNKERKRAIALLNQEFNEVDSVKKITSLHKVIFLDISRYVKNPIDDNRMQYDIETDEIEKDISIDKALGNIQLQIFNMVRRNAMIQERHADRLKTDVILECFKYVKTNQENAYLRMFSNKSENELNEKQEKVSEGIKVLGNEEVEVACNNFFVETKKAIQSLKRMNPNVKDSAYFNLFGELMMNSMTLDKIDKILENCNTYQQNIDKLKQPFTRLCDSVNKFFSETHKKVEIDGRGRLKVNVGNKISNNVTKLSSGEKQLIAIFADMTLNVNNRTSVVLIDEPDLSLHIAWQENLVEALQIANPDIQYVLATHSPSIISKLEWRSNTINLTKREQHGE